MATSTGQGGSRGDDALRISTSDTPGEHPAKDQSKRALRPKDAATLVLVDHTGTAPRILMGQRRSTQVFLPNKFVFPGGRVDRADRSMACLGALSGTDTTRLLHDMKGQPGASRARALALAAIRETFEEAGIVIGEKPAQEAAKPRQSLDRAARPNDDPNQPPRNSWQQFLATGFKPSLAGLTFFARAITPPSRPRRYDTRFFMADARIIAHETGHSDDELRKIGWFTLDEIRALDLPNITRAVVEDLSLTLASPAYSRPVPYYRFVRGTFRRDLID
ncbi:MAG: NUDIX hydrolase [Hyphomicrobiaceae bacterium]